MSLPMRAVLFDLGNTLMYARGPWEPVFARANRALTAALRDAGLPVDARDFPALFDRRLGEYYDQREHSLTEPTAAAVLLGALREVGVLNPAGAAVRNALDAFYTVTQSNWALESDALPTLARLRERGLRLAILSNASDDRDVQQLTDSLGLRPFFEFVLTSAACGYRKPHERIFAEALARLGLPPEQVAMVGDTLRADILGANRCGLYSVWINRRARPPGEQTQAIRPRATIRALDQLPDLFA